MAKASLHGIKTELDGIAPPTEGASLQNDLWYNTYEVALSQYYKYEQKGWELSLGCPPSLYTQTLDDRVRRDRQAYTHLLVSPSASAGYERHDWSGSINASYHKNVGDPGGIYSGYVMNNYRSFQRSYVEQLYPFHSRTVSIGAGGTVTPLPWFNIVLSSGYAWAGHPYSDLATQAYEHRRDHKVQLIIM